MTLTLSFEGCNAKLGSSLDDEGLLHTVALDDESPPVPVSRFPLVGFLISTSGLGSLGLGSGDGSDDDSVLLNLSRNLCGFGFAIHPHKKCYLLIT